jgi:DNA end-binding protein Ku
LALVRVLGDHLVLETMFFASELTDVEDVPGVAKGKAHIEPRQLKMAEQLVESMTIDWDPERYKDEYAKKVKDVIARKLQGGEILESPSSGEGGQVVDLMDALQKSIAATKSTGKKRADTLADVADLRPIARVSAVKHARKRTAHAAKRAHAKTAAKR